MTLIATNTGLVHIQDLPEILGFSWHQFIEMWPKTHSMMIDANAEDGQYDCSKFTNVKTYISMLDGYTRERIRYTYNIVCNKNEVVPILSEEDTLLHLIKIVNNI